jgi:hypothetical protein
MHESVCVQGQILLDQIHGRLRGLRIRLPDAMDGLRITATQRDVHDDERAIVKGPSSVRLDRDLYRSRDSFVIDLENHLAIRPIDRINVPDGRVSPVGKRESMDDRRVARMARTG